MDDSLDRPRSGRVAGLLRLYPDEGREKVMGRYALWRLEIVTVVVLAFCLMMAAYQGAKALVAILHKKKEVDRQ